MKILVASFTYPPNKDGVRTIAVQGEKLIQTFAPRSFDLAYASNALDHALDPVDVIKQMCSLINAEGQVYLWHFANVAIEERYRGLHQWNFERIGRDMRISDGKKSFLLSKRIMPGCLVDCRDESAFGSKVVVTTIRKQ
jgi:hypothetical protein